MEHLKDMENVFVLNHPLIQHKISRLRDENTGTNEFRKLIEEIATLMGYEAHALGIGVEGPSGIVLLGDY